MLSAVWAEAAVAGVFGLLIGSFLNVVIHRLPKIMERQWANECADYLAQSTAAGAADAAATPPGAASMAAAGAQAPAEPYNLVTPRSRCPHCGHAIGAMENIPVLSWLFLRGRCAGCKARISVRYPLVELATAALFAACAWRWGLTPAGAAWAGFAATLLALALIDWDTTLLPDDMTLPLVWAGLIGAAVGWTGTALPAALWGAVAGYLSLWSIYWLFKLLTGKEGMGYGDFKLFAALGAWFGWQALVPMILMASVIGAVAGIAMKVNRSLRQGGYVPFGPFLALAGITALLFGPSAILAVVGL